MTTPTPSLLSSHGLVLVSIARDPDRRLREIAASCGITERSAFSLVTDLVDAGFIRRVKAGRCNSYEINDAAEVPHGASVGALLAALHAAGPVEAR